MSKSNRTLFMTIMAASLIQMVQFTLTPGIAKINTEVFPEFPLSVIQTAMTLPSLFSMVFSLVSAFLIGKGWISKKASVVTGLAFITGTSVVALFFHTQFWHLCLFSVLIGIGMGLYISTSSSIMFDHFNESERRMSVGIQSSAINLGGIIMSVSGGILANMVWFGGYLMLLIGIPIVILALVNIPNDKKKTPPDTARSEQLQKKQAKLKIPPDIFYYGIITFLFLMINTVCSTNISSHLKAAGLGDTSSAGLATAVQMAGGFSMGFFFSRLSAKLKDYAIALTFFIIFVGYTIISIGQSSLIAVFAGIFIVGTTTSIIIPQSLFSTSNRVNPVNSATATAIVNTISPGIGSFISPMVFTPLTIALGGESTNFRYEFVGVLSLLVGIVLIVTTRFRAQKEKKPRQTGHNPYLLHQDGQ